MSSSINKHQYIVILVVIYWCHNYPKQVGPLLQSNNADNNIVNGFMDGTEDHKFHKYKHTARYCKILQILHTANTETHATQHHCV